MNWQSGCAGNVVRIASCSLLAAFTFSAAAEQLDKSDNQLLEETEYRTNLEEVVVVGKQPEWRKEKPQIWRPEEFELAEVTATARMQWLPEYDKDDRENYDKVRDRTGEKAEFKLFEWKF